MFEEGDVFGVAAEGGVHDVADEGDEADEEVDGHVEPHLGEDAGGEAAFDRRAALDQARGEEYVDYVADAEVCVGVVRE